MASWPTPTALGRSRANEFTVTISPSSTTLTTGSALVATVTEVNTTSGSLSMSNTFYLVYPDGTRVALVPLTTKSSTVAAGRMTTVKPDDVTTTEFTTQTGQFQLEVDAVSPTGTVLGSATSSFTVQPLPAGLVVPRFSDLAPSAGVALLHHADQSDCIDAMGTGAAWLDYNRDGFLDLFVTDFNGASHLYENEVGTTGSLAFADVTASAFPGSLTGGALLIPHASGAVAADYDNDGLSDLLVMTSGRPYLFHENGDHTFSDTTAGAGLAGLPAYRGESAAWGDFNRDGLLDLYLVYYNQNCYGTPIQSTALAADHLFQNNGDGTFTDVTSLLGGPTNPALTGLGFQATWFDTNNDLWPDLYVADDYGRAIHANVLWRNAGGSAFTDASASSHLNVKVSAMGIGVGDFNRDGSFDVAVSNIAANVLMKNNGAGVFTNTTRSDGAQRSIVMGSTAVVQSATWGLGFEDLNNDGYQDLLMAGGHVRRKQVDAIPSAVFLNNLNHHLTNLVGDGTMLELANAAGMTKTTARTLAPADFDADGFVDVYVVPYFDENAQLYRNESWFDGNHSHWLSVRLVGAGPGPFRTYAHGSNRDGVGAKLIVTSASGTQYGTVISGTSLGTGNPGEVHFGLAGDNQVASLTIDWPSGFVQTFVNVPADERVVATEGLDVLGTDPTTNHLPG